MQQIPEPHLVIQFPGLEGELHVAIVPRDVLCYNLSVSHEIHGLQVTSLNLLLQLPLTLRRLWSLLTALQLQFI